MLPLLALQVSLVKLLRVVREQLHVTTLATDPGAYTITEWFPEKQRIGDSVQAKYTDA
jgi:hypothetical protein